MRYNSFMVGFSLFDWKRGEIVFVGGVIVAILIISLVQLKTAQVKARDAQRKADVEVVARGVAAYYADHGELPASAASGKVVQCGGLRDVECEWGKDSIEDSDGVKYLDKLPIDPQSSFGKKYVYEKGQEPGKFRVYVALEYSRDSGRRIGLTAGCGDGVQCNWYATQ